MKGGVSRYPAMSFLEANEDVVLHVLQFLSARDAMQLQSCSSSCRKVVCCECLWIFYAQTRIAGLQRLWHAEEQEQELDQEQREDDSAIEIASRRGSYMDRSRQRESKSDRRRKWWLDKVKDAYNFHSFRQLYFTLCMISTSPLPFAAVNCSNDNAANLEIQPILLCMIPSHPDQCRGGFYCLKPATIQNFTDTMSESHNGMVISRIHAVGNYTNDFTGGDFQTVEGIQAAKTYPKFIGHDPSRTDFNYLLTMHLDIIIVSDEMALHEPISFRHLPPLILKSPLSPPLSSEVKNILGCVSSRYSSHGDEIVHISVQERNTSPYAIAEERFGQIQLVGLKVTGDRNVPANRVSFCINIDSEFDPQIIAQADHRVIVYFGENNTTQIFDLRSNAVRIKKWYRGWGQINRVPGQWDPLWVECSLLLFQVNDETSTLFSILWYVNEDISHMMNFKRLIYTT